MSERLDQSGKPLPIHCAICIQDMVQTEARWWRTAKDSLQQTRVYAVCDRHKDAPLPPRPSARPTV